MPRPEDEISGTIELEVDPTETVIDVRCRLLAAETLNREIMAARSAPHEHQTVNLSRDLAFVDPQIAFQDFIVTTGADASAMDPDSGESWQYMGSVHHGPSLVLYHQFRHRHHPDFNRRFYCAVRETAMSDEERGEIMRDD